MTKRGSRPLPRSFPWEVVMMPYRGTLSATPELVELLVIYWFYVTVSESQWLKLKDQTSIFIKNSKIENHMCPEVIYSFSCWPRCPQPVGERNLPTPVTGEMSTLIALMSRIFMACVVWFVEFLSPEMTISASE